MNRRLFSHPYFYSLIAHLLPLVVFVLVSYVFQESKKYFQDFEVYEFPVSQQSPAFIMPPEDEVKKEVKEEKRAVFGASKETLESNSKDAPEVKRGNTVAKQEDDKKLNEDDALRLPIPTAEYLVSIMPKLLSEVRVPYPEEARKNGVHGPVVLDLLIDEAGLVRKIDTVSGPDQTLIDAAVKAIAFFKFSPAQMNQQRVAVRIRYVYRFVLE